MTPLLLRSMLCNNATEARDAWMQWLNTVGDPGEHIRRDTSGLKRLLPALLTAINRNGISVEGVFLTILRSAYVREELRDKTYRQILSTVVARSRSAGVDVILLNGAALAHSVYPNPVLRHCHNIDLYCAATCTQQVATVLLNIGFQQAHDSAQTTEFRHASGLPAEVHQRLLGMGDINCKFATIHSRATILEIDKNRIRVLAPEDCLLQLCAHTLGKDDLPNPVVTCDAWLLIKREPELDWDLLRHRAEMLNLENNLEMLLAYLCKTLD